MMRTAWILLALLMAGAATLPGATAMTPLGLQAEVQVQALDVEAGAATRIDDTTIQATLCIQDQCLHVGESEQDAPTYVTQAAPAPQIRTPAPEASGTASVPAVVWWVAPLLVLGSLFTKLYAWGPGRTTALLAHLLRATLAAVPLLPLFSRIDADQVLENPTRATIADYVEQNPGTTILEVKQNLAVAWGTAVYHLERLEKNGNLVSLRHGNRHHYFTRGTQEARIRREWAALQRPTTRDIARVVLERPGIHQSGICERLGLRSPTASKHLRSLVDGGLVTQERNARFTVYQPTPGLEGAMACVMGDEVGA